MYLKGNLLFRKRKAVSCTPNGIQKLRIFRVLFDFISEMVDVYHDRVFIDIDISP